MLEIDQHSAMDSHEPLRREALLEGDDEKVRDVRLVIRVEHDRLAVDNRVANVVRIDDHEAFAGR